MDKTENPTAKPVKRFGMVSIWPNYDKTTKQTYYKVTIQKAYKDKEGVYKYTNSLYCSDIYLLMANLNQAKDWINQTEVRS